MNTLRIQDITAVTTPVTLRHTPVHMVTRIGHMVRTTAAVITGTERLITATRLTAIRLIMAVVDQSWFRPAVPIIQETALTSIGTDTDDCIGPMRLIGPGRAHNERREQRLSGSERRVCRSIKATTKRVTIRRDKNGLVNVAL